MNTDDLKVIVKVAELGSITAAATNLDTQTATASAAVKRVEKALGTELFIRTTRKLRLSSAGERYLPQCIHALETLNQAKQNIRDDDIAIEGELRIAMPSDLGRNLVLPWLDEIMDDHPNVSLKLNAGDHNVDFYRDSVDIALRYGSPKDASLYGFKICDVPRLLCASQKYIDLHGAPQHPHELASHQGVFYQLQGITYDLWKFVGQDREYKIKMTGNRASNDGELVRRWCVAGKGVSTKSCLDVSADLLANRLIKLMPNYETTSTELWLICPSRQSITPAVRLLRDTFKKKCHAILDELHDAGIL